MSAKYKKSVAQIILRWLIQRGFVVIPKSVRKERMTENFNSLDSDLDEVGMGCIKNFDTKTLQNTF